MTDPITISTTDALGEYLRKSKNRSYMDANLP